jgi:Bacterial extracellular solute-binding proteins, family 3
MIRHILPILALTVLQCAARAADIAYYPRPESALDKRSEYPIKLLELALQKSGDQYRIGPSPVPMQQGRAFQEVQGNSRWLDIMWTMTTSGREQQALPIRIPIDKGLLGWRLLLVSRQNREPISHVHSVRDLARFSAGLGHDWPDVDIFKANGLATSTSANYELLFRMLADDQFQYFPRSVEEIWDELDQHRQYDLTIADQIAIHYPAPLYYFVNKNNAKLAAAVQDGLEKALADGSFDRLFHKYYDDQLRRADFGHRTVVDLANPLLPKETPLARKELWLQVQGQN